MNRFVLAAALACATPAIAQTSYFRAIEDLPVAPGLTESQLAFDFDSGQGRMLGAVARGRTTAPAVRAFYLETLPALGWAYSPVPPDQHGAGADEEDHAFLRGRERLLLTIRDAGEEVVLEVRLVAAPAPGN